MENIIPGFVGPGHVRFVPQEPDPMRRAGRARTNLCQTADALWYPQDHAFGFRDEHDSALVSDMFFENGSSRSVHLGYCFELPSIDQFTRSDRFFLLTHSHGHNISRNVINRGL